MKISGEKIAEGQELLSAISLAEEGRRMCELLKADHIPKRRGGSAMHSGVRVEKRLSQSYVQNERY